VPRAEAGRPKSIESRPCTEPDIPSEDDDDDGDGAENESPIDFPRLLASARDRRSGRRTSIW